MIQPDKRQLFDIARCNDEINFDVCYDDGPAPLGYNEKSIFISQFT